MKRINELRTVFVHPKSKKIYIEFWDENGKIRQKTTGKEGTEKNLKYVKEELSLKFIARLKAKTLLKERPKTIKDYAVLYLSFKEKLTRYPSIENRVNRIVKKFGSKTPSEITPLEIQAFLNELDVSKATLKDWRLEFKGILDCAVDALDLARNPLEDSKKIMRRVTPSPSRRTDSEKKPFSKEEVKILLEEADNDLKNYLGIAFYTGARPEEIIGLHIEDCDFERMVLKVERTVSKSSLKGTKTQHSERTIPIFEGAVPFVKSQIETANQKGTKWLFSDEDGKRLNDIENIRGKKYRKGPWTKLLEKVNLPYRQIMNTRHTWAVLALKSKQFTPQEIAGIMGHTTLRMLWQHYARFIDKDYENVERRIDIFT